MRSTNRLLMVALYMVLHAPQVLAEPLAESSSLTAPLTENTEAPLAGGPSGESAPWLPQDNDLLILELRVANYTMGDVIGAYRYEDVTLLPLGALSTILSIAVDVGEQSASGFVIREENTFNLDTRRREVVLKGQAQAYDGDLVKLLDDDIYVESTLLGSWFDMTFDIDLYASRVVIRSEEKLPFLAKIEREERIGKALAGLNQKSVNYPRHYEPYRAYSVPFVDQNFSLNQRYSDAGDDTSLVSTTHVTADLLMHESSWYLTMNDQDGVDDFRVTLGRTDPEGGLLGPLDANEYKFGHVSEPRIGLINVPSNLEYGAVVSSYPVGIQNEYDRHRFSGELLPGWVVELYRNNALIGYQDTPINGQYDFQDVPLLFGSNNFRLVFYGPRGEVREITRQFQPSSAMTRPGEFNYRASGISDEEGEARSTLQFDYGLTKQLSTTLNYVTLPLLEGSESVQHNYVGAGLTGYWDAVLASVMVHDDSESGSAMAVDLQTRISGTTIGLKETQLDHFFSEEFLPSAQEIARRSEIKINTAIPQGYLPRMPLMFGYKRDQFAAGGELTEYSNQLSLSSRGVAMTNYLKRQQVSGQEATSSGSFRVSSNIKGMRFRGSLAYLLAPESELSNINMTLEPGLYRGYRIGLGLNHALQQELTEVSVTANKVSGKYGLSFGARYNSDNELNLSMNLSFGFGYEPKVGTWRSEARSVANMGSVSARMFVDANQDGIYNGEDEPLEDIGVRVNGGYNRARSDKEGILFLTGVPPHQPVDLTMAPETLVDPLWSPALDGVEVVARPGNAIEIDFPIFMSGEIDGTVYLNKNGRQYGVGDVKLELVDKQGQVISSTRSAYDGFYVLSKVPIGDYRVRIAREQLLELGLVSSAEEAIKVVADDPFTSGIDFNLELAQ